MAALSPLGKVSLGRKVAHGNGIFDGELRAISLTYGPLWL